MATGAERPEDAVPAAGGAWLRDAARLLDPRVRAALDVSEPGTQEAVAVSEETQSLLTAAVRELQAETPPARGGVAPVLGAGVAAQFLRFGPGENASPSSPEGSRIDERR
jgi:hypothetical protein